MVVATIKYVPHRVPASEASWQSHISLAINADIADQLSDASSLATVLSGRRVS